jgi:GH25 family lysozyme M1 (1,4-beta-N-acetylmuramidase)
MLRSTYGTRRDRRIGEFWSSYRAWSGHPRFPIGFYHFFRFGHDPDKQAAAFLDVVHDKKAPQMLSAAVVLANNARFDLPVPGNEEKFLADVARFLKRVEPQMDRPLMLFVSQELADLELPPDLSGRALWVESFGGTPPRQASRYSLWQFGTGSIPGVGSVVALSVFNGSQEQFAAFVEGR